MALTKPPSPEEFEYKMKTIKETFCENEYSCLPDYEALHVEMDSYILDVLETLGFEKGVKIFRSVPKWYA